jgi:hypothetical protein
MHFGVSVFLSTIIPNDWLSKEYKFDCLVIAKMEVWILTIPHSCRSGASYFINGIPVSRDTILYTADIQSVIKIAGVSSPCKNRTCVRHVDIYIGDI